MGSSWNDVTMLRKHEHMDSNRQASVAAESVQDICAKTTIDELHDRMDSLHSFYAFLKYRERSSLGYLR